jgi:hypothetical protein
MTDDAVGARFSGRPMCGDMDARNVRPLRCAEPAQDEHGLVAEELPRGETRYIGTTSVEDGVGFPERERSHTVEGCRQV